MYTIPWYTVPWYTIPLYTIPLYTIRFYTCINKGDYTHIHVTHIG